MCKTGKLTLTAAGQGRSRQPHLGLAPSNHKAQPYGVNQGVASHQQLQMNPSSPYDASVTAGPLPPHSTARVGRSLTESSVPEPYITNNNYSSQRLLGIKRPCPGESSSSNPPSVPSASTDRLCSDTSAAALEPAAGPCGTSANSATTINSFAAAGCPQSMALEAHITVAHSQPNCSNCSTYRCPAKTWRSGPEGPRTLCNRCGILYKRRGAGAFITGSRAAVVAAQQLAAQPVADPPQARHRPARTSSCNNNVGKSEMSSASPPVPAALTAATIDFGNPSAAAPAEQPRPPKRAKNSKARESAEPSRPHQGQGQKRLRDASGEADCQLPSMVLRSRKLISAAVSSAASGGVRQAAAAVSGPGDAQQSDGVLSAPDMRAEAVNVLSTVAPGGSREGSTVGSTVGVRKSRRVALRRAREGEALQASLAAAQEAEDVAQILLGMADGCWLDSLVDVLDGELNAI